VLAFRVEVDGEELAVAGVEDWAVLALHITASRSSPTEHGRSHVSIGGLALPGEAPGHHHFRWKEKDLETGARVVVTLLDTDTPTAPVKRFRSDAEVQEDAFTEEEAREMRLKDYLELKKEFGADHG
jgi:hypothetical protein